MLRTLWHRQTLARWVAEMGAEEVLILLVGMLVKNEPAIETFVRNLIDGHPDAVRRVRDILPARSRVEAEL